MPHWQKLKQREANLIKCSNSLQRSAAMLSACVAPAAGCGIGAVIASTDFKREFNYGKENIGCDLWK